MSKRDGRRNTSARPSRATTAASITYFVASRSANFPSRSRPWICTSIWEATQKFRIWFPTRETRAPIQGARFVKLRTASERSASPTLFLSIARE